MVKFEKIKSIIKKLLPEILFLKYRKIKNLFNDYNEKIKLKNLTKNNFKTERALRHHLINGKINVGFILAQEAIDWNKLEPIFLALKNDSRFKVTVITFPSWYGDSRVIVKDKSINTNFEFLKRLYEGEDITIINGWENDKVAIELKSFDFSYIFYNTPYQWPLPDSYQFNRVSRLSKICYTPYGFTLSNVFRDVSSSWDDFRYIYCVYACSESEKAYFDKKIKKIGFPNYQRAAFCGFPRIYQFMQKKDITTKVWSFSQNKYRAIWTPRWSTDDSIAGSNFLKYKDFMLKLVKENRDIDFVFRPHPLTFGNFIKTGQMSKEEVEEYKNNCYKINSYLDESSEYASTFWQSNVLITDFSSIIIEYFSTGNPIIFCTTKTNMNEPTEEFQKILKCCYIANCEDDIRNYLIELKNGKDLLKEKREIAIKEILGTDIELIPKKIGDDLFNDWKLNNKN